MPASMILLFSGFSMPSSSEACEGPLEPVSGDTAARPGRGTVPAPPSRPAELDARRALAFNGGRMLGNCRPPKAERNRRAQVVEGCSRICLLSWVVRRLSGRWQRQRTSRQNGLLTLVRVCESGSGAVSHSRGAFILRCGVNMDRRAGGRAGRQAGDAAS